jgi:respiratory burst oxidase
LQVLTITKVLSVKKHAGNVLELYLSKPPSWKHKPGMYCRLKVPAISSTEWHSFSIATAPDDPHIGFFIRVCGDWTKAVSGHN